MLDEARRLVEEEGLEALSMRTLGERLGVSPMALYNHVSDKGDLLQGIARAVVQDFQVPSGVRDWREQVRVAFRALRRVCLANPRSIPLVESAEALDPTVFRSMETVLAALHAAGLEPRQALQVYFLLTSFTMGQASYQVKGPFPGVDPVEAARRGVIPQTEFPLVASAISQGKWDFDAGFELGLAIIIEGVAAYVSARRAP